MVIMVILFLTFSNFGGRRHHVCWRLLACHLLLDLDPSCLKSIRVGDVKHGGGKRVYSQIMLVYQNKSEGTNWLSANTSAWNILRNRSFASWSWNILRKGPNKPKTNPFQVRFVWKFSVPPKYHMCSMVFAWFTICFPHVPQQTCPQSWVNPVNPTCRVTMAVRPGLGQRDLRSWSDEIRLMYTSVNKCQSHMKHCETI